MSGFPLRHRRQDLSEVMDSPDCDRDRLNRTFAAFRTVNLLLSGWRRLYTKCVRPYLQPGQLNTILDIGCGGGDVLVYLVRRAQADGFDVHGTGVDPDPRAIEWARRAVSAQHGVDFEIGYADCVSDVFHVVVSNHVLHHLSNLEAKTFLKQSLALSSGVVVHNDISRSLSGLVLFQAVRPFFPGTYIGADGTQSIRRSFRQHELLELAGNGWEPVRAAPFRVGLVATP